MSLVHRVAIVTGAGQGIGRSIALRLASDGFDLCLNDTSNSMLEETVEMVRCSSSRSKVITVCCDISVEENVKNLVDTAAKVLGTVDVMVANAGIGCQGPLLQANTEDLDEILSVNVKGSLFCYKHAALRMIEQGRGGRIIGASSIIGKRGYQNFGLYGMSKFAIRSLTQTAAQEWGIHGITVNSYAPGIIDTGMTREFDREVTSKSNSPQGSYLQKLLPLNSLNRGGSPDDVANVVSFLVSNDAALITGQSIIIDGGTIFD